jgi:hypothetical protein
MPGSSNWSFFIRSSHQNPVGTSPVLYTCLMYVPLLSSLHASCTYLSCPLYMPHVRTSPVLYTCHMPCPAHSCWFDNQNNIFLHPNTKLKFEVLTAMFEEIQVFWDVTSYWHFLPQDQAVHLGPCRSQALGFYKTSGTNDIASYLRRPESSKYSSYVPFKCFNYCVCSKNVKLKLQLFLCITKHHVMKKYGRKEKVGEASSSTF